MTEFPDAPAVPATESATPASRPGVPVWRIGKPDAFLAAATDVARAAVLEIAATEDIGPHSAVRSEGIRTVTHLFECLLPGYVGWQWFATLTRVSRAKDATVNEVGLLPTNDSVLAPPWVPWAQRVRPEDDKHEESEDSHDPDAADVDTAADSADGYSADDAAFPADADDAPED